MARWAPDAPRRLQQAALELYVLHGFEATTVTDIAARAGVTERTFFRHFADKREVLFEGAREFQQWVVDGVVAAPAGCSAWDAVCAGLDSLGRNFPTPREAAAHRATLVASSVELRERELVKLAALGSAVADALRARGITEPTASLTAETGVAVLRVGFERWVTRRRYSLARTLADCAEELARAVAAQ